MARERVLLLAATTAYGAEDFVAAADRLGVEVVLGSDRCHVLAGLWPEGSWSLDFRRPERAAAQIAERAVGEPLAGVVPTDERTALIAALAAARLGLRHNPPEAARAAGDKLATRRLLSAAGLRQPGFREIPLGGPDDLALADLELPAVVKPRHLSASRGVMRADSRAELAARLARLRRLLARPEIRADTALVESFVPGAEVALEGLLCGGRLTALALFDKPDPLDGPTFAETLYVTPSRLPAPTRGAIEREAAEAAAALGLCEGPVHAELRLSPDGPVVLELAARSIGGLCSRALRFGAGLSLEELIVAHAVGRDATSLERSGPPASGVLMIPVPEPGVFRRMRGLERARRLPRVRDVVVTVRPGESVEPLPEGHAYLGFAFAGAETPEEVTEALRAVERELKPEITPQIA